MLIGFLMLLGPIVVFTITLPYSRWFTPNLRKVYRTVGGLLVFLGSGTSLYFAMYTGDQGGIAAYLFQLTIITVYILFSIVLAVINWRLLVRSSRSENS
jgi:hypothetical protein